MDHIESLPLSEGYNSILVVVCCLMKQAIFIPTHTTDTAPILAQHFIMHVFSKHSLSNDIVSDRGHLFISKFWKSLCSALDIQVNLSTAYHLETDGQTECINQILEQYLKIFINYKQNDSTTLLPLTEFIYNNTPHSSTKVSPFFANKGYHPKLIILINDILSLEAQQTAQDLSFLYKHL
jgi:hypothetical protein